MAKNMKDAGEIMVYMGSDYVVDQALNPDDELRRFIASLARRDIRKRNVNAIVSFDTAEKVE